MTCGASQNTSIQRYDLSGKPPRPQCIRPSLGWATPGAEGDRLRLPSPQETIAVPALPSLRTKPSPVEPQLSRKRSRDLINPDPLFDFVRPPAGPLYPYIPLPYASTPITATATTINGADYGPTSPFRDYGNPPQSPGQYHELVLPGTGRFQANLTPRQRVSIACTHCRHRKIRCSGFKNAPGGKCHNCAHKLKECIFEPVFSSNSTALVPASIVAENACRDSITNTHSWAITQRHGNYMPAKSPVSPSSIQQVKCLAGLGKLDQSGRMYSHSSSEPNLTGAIRDSGSEAQYSKPSSPQAGTPCADETRSPSIMDLKAIVEGD